MNNTLKNCFVGIFIGIAGLIPGLSGGTIAVIAGIYDDAIEAVSSFFRKNHKRDYNRKEILLFLLPIILGTVFSVFLFSRTIEYFIIYYPEQITIFFIGLITGSIPILYRKASQAKFQLKLVLPLIICLAILLYIQYADRPGLNQPITELTIVNSILVFTAGIISIAGGIIPGLSGSFLLLIMGMYSTMIHAINQLNIPILLVLAAGAVSGLITVSRLISYLLKQHNSASHYAIIGLLLGSIINLWPGITLGMPGIVSIIWFIMGFIISYTFNPHSSIDIKKLMPWSII